MTIRPLHPPDRPTLLDIWLRSVRTTHTFVSEADIQSFTPIVRDYLSSPEPEFWVAAADTGQLMGFMGLTGNRMESLFLDPQFHRQGIGRRLVQHAHALHGELTTDVNEQNTPARKFYESCGFVVTGRSEYDDTGRPYPLLHMRLPAQTSPSPASD